MADFKIPNINNIKEKGKTAGTKIGGHLKTRWIDYIILFFICLVLGAFDIFILKRSDNFLSADYWAHAGCRIAAYVLAGILGFRLAYPKFKAECQDLIDALEKNRKLIIYKEIDGALFGDFIYQINIRVKKAAWKHKITKKLKSLNRRNPNFFDLWYVDKKEEHFDRFKPKKYFKFIKNLRYNHLKARAVKYQAKRKTLESLIDDNYIDENITVLNVKYPIVDKNHFARIDTNGIGYDFYKTVANVSGNAARQLINIVITAMIFTLIIGAIAIDLDKELLEDRVLGIFRIIINAILDIGLTLWQFVKCYYHSDKIVRQEDLRAVLDQNELLTEYKKSLPAELKSQAESEFSQSVVKSQSQDIDT